MHDKKSHGIFDQQQRVDNPQRNKKGYTPILLWKEQRFRCLCSGPLPAAFQTYQDKEILQSWKVQSYYQFRGKYRNTLRKGTKIREQYLLTPYTERNLLTYTKQTWVKQTASGNNIVILCSCHMPTPVKRTVLWEQLTEIYLILYIKSFCRTTKLSSLARKTSVLTN